MGTTEDQRPLIEEGLILQGMSALTLSASFSAFKPAECIGDYCSSATPAQYALFFSGLYLIALGTGGIKPCLVLWCGSV